MATTESDAIPNEGEPSVEENATPEGRSFPSPLTILIGVIIGVWILGLILPSGAFDIGDDGRPVPGSFHEVESPLTFRESITDLLLSPVNGLYGIQNLETGQVGPFNAGVMFGSAQVFLFILAIGGFMTVVFKTGALDLGIAHLAHRFRTRGPLLIIILSVVFGILGSVMSWSDETLGFYALIIPLMLSLGYDRITTVAVVTIAPFVGSIGSTVNPFRIGIASDAAGIGIGDGLGLRLLMFVLTLGITIVYTLRYAQRVKANPELAIVPHSPEDAEMVAQANNDHLEPLTGSHKGVIALVTFTFVLLIFSIVPWGAILNNTLVDPDTHESIVKAFGWELGWWLPELSAMFVIMSIVVAVVARMKEGVWANAFIRGVMDFTGPAILVAFARAVSVIMTNTKTIDTVLNSMEGIVDGRSTVGFVILLSIVSLPLGFLVGSGSAGMALVMPILAPLGDFANVDRSLIVTTYNAMGGWLLLLLPTNALLVAGIGLAKVSFGQYLKFVVPLMAMLLAAILVVLLIGLALG